MIRGLPASILLHVGVIASSYIVLPIFEKPLEQVVIVPIDLVSVSEVNNIAPVVRPAEIEPEPESKPEPEPEEELPEEPEIIPEEIAPEEDIVPPAAAEQEEVEPEAPEDVIPEEVEPEEEEPEPAPEAPEEKPKPKEAEPDELDDILNDANLFNRERETVKAPPPPTPEPEVEPDAPPPEARKGVGERTANTARIEAIVLSQMKVCWRSLEDLPEPERLTVSVRVQLNADGSLRDDVELVQPRRAPIGDRYMSVAIDRALRAVRTCQPYRLPVEDYEAWEELVLNFRHGG
jgi:hypothetical protein